MMITTRFPVARVQAKRRITCAACGKRRTRQMTFENTVNPFNQNPDGSIRTYAQVMEKITAESEAWQPTLCASCEPLHRPSNFGVKRSEFVGDCACGNRWPCVLTEDYAELVATPCLCQPVARICARCTRLGQEFGKPVTPS